MSCPRRALGRVPQRAKLRCDRVQLLPVVGWVAGRTFSAVGELTPLTGV